MLSYIEYSRSIIEVNNKNVYYVLSKSPHRRQLLVRVCLAAASISYVHTRLEYLLRSQHQKIVSGKLFFEAFQKPLQALLTSSY